MAVLKIPTSTVLSSYTQRTALDGRDFILRFQFNQRLGRWHLSIYDQDDAPIALGLRCSANTPLIRRLTNARRPVGEIYVIDLEGGGDDTDALALIARDPGLGELGARFIAVYFDADELGRDA